jgi:methylmalonyl-CoA/ethylmalonyl-CoA epimerase
MDSTKINHIGIAVPELNKAIEQYKKLGLKLAHTEEVSGMKVRVGFMPIGETRLEFLEPLSEDSTIATFLKKRGPGVHHICIEVADIKAALNELAQDSSVELVDKTPRRGAENSLVAFIHPKSMHGVLVELCESNSGE